LALPGDPGDDFTDSESIPPEVRAVFKKRSVLAAKRAAHNSREREVAAMHAEMRQDELQAKPKTRRG